MVKSTPKKRYSAHCFVEAAALGHAVTPDPNKSAYVWGPDATGRMCHVGSYTSYRDATLAAAKMNGERSEDERDG